LKNRTTEGEQNEKECTSTHRFSHVFIFLFFISCSREGANEAATAAAETCRERDASNEYSSTDAHEDPTH
jgi:hypothetical protein